MTVRSFPTRHDAASPAPGQVVGTDIPARLDRLPWSCFHWLVVVALGITWILDGLEVTIAGSLTGALQESPTLRFSPTDIGLSASAYLAGNVIGAALFGWLTDKLGRKRLFNITLGLYLLATAATASAWDFWSFCLFRFLTGAGIGGEYTAINSAIQEMIPARRRGWTDLAINGSFWMGAALGAAGSVVLLDPAVFGAEVGWRLAFGIGAFLGLGILFLRRWVPESPRWLMTHGRSERRNGWSATSRGGSPRRWAICRCRDRGARASTSARARPYATPCVRSSSPTGNGRYSVSCCWFPRPSSTTPYSSATA